MDQAYPFELIRAFRKEAEIDSSERPEPRSGSRHGVGRSAGSRFVPQGAQTYTRPNPPVAATQPGTVLPQLSVPPPPVQ